MSSTDHGIEELNEKLNKQGPKEGGINTDNSTFYSDVSDVVIKKKETGEHHEEKLKCNTTLFSLCMIVGMSNSAYALLAPFMPLYLEKEVGIHDEKVNGSIFA